MYKLRPERYIHGSSLYSGPMDHIMERTVHRGMAGVTLGNEVFTDLDFVDDVALLAELLEVLVLAMTITHGRGGGLWSPDKLVENQNTAGSPSMPCSIVQVADGHVEMVDAFVYLGSMIDSSGGSRG